MINLIFLRGLCGYVRINILTLSPTRFCFERPVHINLQGIITSMREKTFSDCAIVTEHVQNIYLEDAKTPK